MKQNLYSSSENRKMRNKTGFNKNGSASAQSQIYRQKLQGEKEKKDFSDENYNRLPWSGCSLKMCFICSVWWFAQIWANTWKLWVSIENQNICLLLRISSYRPPFSLGISWQEFAGVFSFTVTELSSSPCLSPSLCPAPHPLQSFTESARPCRPHGLQLLLTILLKADTNILPTWYQPFTVTLGNSVKPSSRGWLTGKTALLLKPSLPIFNISQAAESSLLRTWAPRALWSLDWQYMTEVLCQFPGPGLKKWLFPLSISQTGGSTSQIMEKPMLGGHGQNPPSRWVSEHVFSILTGLPHWHGWSVCPSQALTQFQIHTWN